MPRKVSVTKKKFFPRRKGQKLKGSGAYTYDKPGPIGRIGRSIGKYAGKTIGDAILPGAGGVVGSIIGDKLGGLAHYPARLFGSGDYYTADGTRVLSNDPITFESSNSDGVLICHREYIGDIITSSVAGDFKIQAFGINPSDAGTFPWLSSIAQLNFQQYRFEGLVFEYRSFSCDALNSVNTALGSVFAAINYDYSDPLFESRMEIENSDWSRSIKPSESVLFPVECKKSITGLNQGLLYIVNGTNIPTGTDPKTYYLGRLQIATTGFQGTSVNIGSLYVTYKVRLYKPLMSKPLANAMVYSMNRTGADNTNRLGTGELYSPYNCDSIGVTLGTNTITISKNRLEAGTRFYMFCNWVGDSTASVNAPSLSPTQGSGQFAIYMSNASTPFAQQQGYQPRSAVVTDTSSWNAIEFGVSNPNVDTIISVGSFTPPANASVQIMIYQICSLDKANIGYLPDN